MVDVISSDNWLNEHFYDSSENRNAYVDVRWIFFLLFWLAIFFMTICALAEFTCFASMLELFAIVVNELYFLTYHMSFKFLDNRELVFYSSYSNSADSAPNLEDAIPKTDE